MKELRFSLFVLLLCSCTIANAQSLEQTKKGYMLNGIEYKTNEEILELLRPRSLALEAYQDAKRRKKVANVLGVTSLVGLGATALVISRVDGQGASNLGYYFLGLRFFGIAALTGIAGMYLSTKSGKNKRQVVDYYNASLLGQLPTNNFIEINLKTTNNGLGLVISF